MELTGIKNIIFDLGNVIIDIDHNKVTAAFQHLLGDVYFQMKKDLAIKNILNEFEVAAISTDEFISFFKSYKPSLSADKIIDSWNSMLLDIPKERLALINQLAKKKCVFLLSNTNEIHLDFINKYVENHFGLTSISEPFEKAYFSHKMRLRKPNPKIFEVILRDKALVAKETLFVDDSEEHIITAKQLNLKTHHLLGDETILDIFNEN